MKYFIIGNGGLAKEILFLSKEVFGSTENFGGFIDYKPKESIVHCLDYDYPVIDEEVFFSMEESNSHLYIGIGDPDKLRKIIKKFKNYKFPNLSHPNVIMDKSVILGNGNILTAGCILTVDIHIGNFNVFNLNTTIGHDTQIGSCNIFNPGSNISGSVIIKNYNLFGTNSTVLQGLTIESNSIIGAASLVNKDVGNNLVVVGVPAKQIKQNITNE